MQILSPQLLTFLHDLEIVSRADDPVFSYIACVDKNTEFTASFYLRYRKEQEAKYPSIIDELNQLLSAKYHLEGNDVISGLLAMWALKPKANRADTNVHTLFSLIRPIKLKQYLIFDGATAERIEQLNCLDYTIGSINYDKLDLFLGNHSTSDYAKRYRNLLENRAGIEVKTRPVSVLDIFHWVEACNIDTKSLPAHAEACINYYLYHISLVQLNFFKTDFEQQQQLVTAYCGILYGLNDFEWLGFTFLNVFFEFAESTKRGWVVSSRFRYTEVQFPDSRLIRLADQFVKKNKMLITNADSIFLRQFKIVSEFFAHAERHNSLHNYDQAYIELFVGIDFLLAPDTKASRTLKDRTALLVHRYFNRTFADQSAILDQLYHHRNQFVHNGIRVDRISLSDLRDISKVIFLVLLNLHKKYKNQMRYGSTEWLADLDAIADRLKKQGNAPTAKELRQIGVEGLKDVPTMTYLAQLFSTSPTYSA
jgi:hypothetical protein